MKILAVVPARGGSKRLPGKNIKVLAGKPLICWTIDVAKEIESVCDILVSTDDQNIACVASDAGALVPWVRPGALATDEAAGIDVCLHALDWYEKMKHPVDGLLFLQPTSPFRQRDTLLRGIKLFQANQNQTVLGVSPTLAHPQWCFRLDYGSLQASIDSEGLNLRSQDLPPAYVVNGSFYLASPTLLRQSRSFFSDEITPLVDDDPRASIDIDTPWDWMMAEFIASKVTY